MKFYLVSLLVAIVIGLAARTATAQEMETSAEVQAWQSLRDRAANTSFLVLAGPNEPDDKKRNERGLKVLQALTRGADQQIDKVTTIRGNNLFGDFVVAPLPPQEARLKLQREGLASEVAAVVPNGIVYGFARECDDPENYPGTQRMPKGVERVAEDSDNTPSYPDSYAGAGKIFVIDSGIDPAFDTIDGRRKELNVLARRICNSADCNTSNMADPDNIGHGTMIAGIAAAKIDNSTGLVGVAPGAGLVSVKIFDLGIPATTFDVALSALTYVATAGTSGDVVNISWGMEYNPTSSSIQSQIEAKLKALADAGLRISIAAGNVHVLGGSGYVALISPARIGGYRSTTNDGGIFTVSGVRSVEKGGDWKDRFWADSAYGNPQKDSAGTVVRQGPPDFAEPAFEIESLWPAGPGKVNTCYGTSFAAAHMSGILVRGQPGIWPSGNEKRAEKDPSAIKPNLTGYLDALKDPIGVSPDFKPAFPP